jgi:ABC-type nitrate/sulfonate/bicarbonate transport system substrate-binding protein
VPGTRLRCDAMALLRRALVTTHVLIACWVLCLLPASAQSLQTVSVIVFPGGFNWPIWVAQERGYFAKSGVEVTLTNTPNSVFQVTNLMEGKFDIAVTAIDNVIAYAPKVRAKYRSPKHRQMPHVQVPASQRPVSRQSGD